MRYFQTSGRTNLAWHSSQRLPCGSTTALPSMGSCPHLAGTRNRPPKMYRSQPPQRTGSVNTTIAGQLFPAQRSKLTIALTIRLFLVSAKQSGILKISIDAHEPIEIIRSLSSRKNIHIDEVLNAHIVLIEITISI